VRIISCTMRSMEISPGIDSKMDWNTPSSVHVSSCEEFRDLSTISSYVHSAVPLEREASSWTRLTRSSPSIRCFFYCNNTNNKFGPGRTGARRRLRPGPRFLHRPSLSSSPALTGLGRFVLVTARGYRSRIPSIRRLTAAASLIWI
jgi:hypothetical protein